MEAIARGYTSPTAIGGRLQISSQLKAEIATTPSSDRAGGNRGRAVRVLFSKTGFTDGVRRRAERDRVVLVDADTLCA